MSDASVIMPCHNRGHNIQRVLAAYDRQVGNHPFTLIAVDDASTDDTLAQLTAFSPQNFDLVVRHNAVNSGPAFSRNAGLAEATSPIVIFVGDDIVPHRAFIRSHLRVHEWLPEPEIAILGHIEWPKDMPVNTLMRHIDGIGAEQFSYHYLRDGQEYDFRHFYTANISLKRSMLSTVDHGFDTDFPLAAFEDVELAYRLKQNGLRIIYSSAPRAGHYHYHTVWTFSKRQYGAGRMACVLDEKHPGILSNGVQRLGWLAHLPPWLVTAYSKIKPHAEPYQDIEIKALRLASFYEWTQNDLLDGLYLEILDYYWKKGLIKGRLPDSSASRILIRRQANARLKPAIDRFLRLAKEQSISTPY